MTSLDDVDRGTPGGSLLRQYEQRRSRREQEVRSRHPKLGGLVLRLQQEPATTSSLLNGARGEAYVAQRLQQRCGPTVELLFNRRLSRRGRDGDIDVLAVTANGVHVVDVKRYQRATVRVRRRGGLLTRLEEELLINGRDRTSLADGMDRQRLVVRRLLDGFPGGHAVALHLEMCFVDADLPLIPERVRDIALLGSKGVARRMNAEGPYGAELRSALVRYLAHELPPA